MNITTLNNEYSLTPSTSHDDNIISEARAILRSRLAKGTLISSPTVCFDFLELELTGLEREVMLGVWLDSEHKVIKTEMLAIGTIASATIHTREIAKQALFCNAAALIIAHNHPSGKLAFSRQDKAITERIKAAMELLDVRLLDHVLVGAGVLSMAEEGIL